MHHCPKIVQQKASFQILDLTMATSGGGGCHIGNQGGGEDSQVGAVQIEPGQVPTLYASLYLKKDELARILYKKMKLEPKNILWKNPH